MDEPYWRMRLFTFTKLLLFYCDVMVILFTFSLFVMIFCGWSLLIVIFLMVKFYNHH